MLNATFGNAAELIVALFALHRGLIGVVKASIIGNVLLVLGASLFAGGIRHSRQTFNAMAAGMSATLLALAAIGLLIPAIFHASIVIDSLLAVERGEPVATDVDQQRPQQRRDQEQTVSLEIAVGLFAVYVLTLVFSLKMHRHLYEFETQPTRRPEPVTEQHGARWSPKAAMGVLIGATLVVGLMSELLVRSIEGRSPIAIGGWLFLEENFSGSPKSEACAGAVVE